MRDENYFTLALNTQGLINFDVELSLIVDCLTGR